MNPAEYERMFRLEDSYWWFVGRRRLVDAVLRSLYVRRRTGTECLAILDIGCGTGATSARLTRLGRVVSADASLLALHYARGRGLRFLVAADAMRLPLASDRFDVVVATDVLEHLDDDAAALAELHRVLKPGGRIVATVPAYPHLWSEHDIALMHYRRYVRQVLADRFGVAGFHVEKLSHTMTLLYPVIALQRRLNARKPPHSPPVAAVPRVPAILNAILTRVLDLENTLARRVDFAYGATILCVARKVSGTAESASGSRETSEPVVASTSA